MVGGGGWGTPSGNARTAMVCTNKVIHATCPCLQPEGRVCVCSVCVVRVCSAMPVFLKKKVCHTAMLAMRLTLLVVGKRRVGKSLWQVTKRRQGGVNGVCNNAR